MQHAGGEDDKDPGVDDGVHGDKAEGDQVQSVRLHVSPEGVDVHSELRDGQERRRRRRGKKEIGCWISCRCMISLLTPCMKPESQPT